MLSVYHNLPFAEQLSEQQQLPFAEQLPDVEQPPVTLHSAGAAALHRSLSSCRSRGHWKQLLEPQHSARDAALCQRLNTLSDAGQLTETRHLVVAPTEVVHMLYCMYDSKLSASED